jgi:hypothetical protein
MKIIILFTVAIALSSCATKNYLVGSANDRKGPPKHPGAKLVLPQVVDPLTSPYSGKSGK